jgi:hypothetical protein
VPTEAQLQQLDRCQRLCSYREALFGCLGTDEAGP